MSKKEKTKEVVKPVKVTQVKSDCRLSKEHKRYMKLLYKGKMSKTIRKFLGGPDRERSMMVHDVKKPAGYTGI